LKLEKTKTYCDLTKKETQKLRKKTNCDLTSKKKEEAKNSKWPWKLNLKLRNISNCMDKTSWLK